MTFIINKTNCISVVSLLIDGVDWHTSFLLLYNSVSLGLRLSYFLLGIVKTTAFRPSVSVFSFVSSATEAPAVGKVLHLFLDSKRLSLPNTTGESAPVAGITEAALGREWSCPHSVGLTVTAHVHGPDKWGLVETLNDWTSSKTRSNSGFDHLVLHLVRGGRTKPNHVTISPPISDCQTLGMAVKIKGKTLLSKHTHGFELIQLMQKPQKQKQGLCQSTTVKKSLFVCL